MEESMLVCKGCGQDPRKSHINNICPYQEQFSKTHLEFARQQVLQFDAEVEEINRNDMLSVGEKLILIELKMIKYSRFFK